MTVETIAVEKLTDGLIFGEGIRWTGKHIVLSDMIGKRVVKVDPNSGAIETLLELESQPNGLVSLDDGSLLITSMFDSKILKLDSAGKVTEYADISSVTTGYLGDIVMSQDGALYIDDIGSRVFHGEEPGLNGRIVRVSSNGDVSIMVDNLGFPNGVTISADGKKLYLIETLGDIATMSSTINVYDIDAEGNLGPGEKFATSESGFFDGMCMDSEGGFWVCSPSKGEVFRFDQSGNNTHRLDLTDIEPIACTIGGENGQTLFVTGVDALGEKNMFDEMQAARTKNSIWAATIPFTKGSTRP